MDPAPPPPPDPAPAPPRAMFLGRSQAIAKGSTAGRAELPPHHLVTHGVIVGMTGSGKTGLAMVLVEEALRAEVPVLLVDVKGDLANLLLSFPELAPRDFEPWIDEAAAKRESKTPLEIGERLAKTWRDGLAGWELGAGDVAKLRASIAPRLFTPGSSAGEPVHVLSALEIVSPLWDEDEEAAREGLSGALSLVLRLVDRDPDPAKSREHVLLAHFAERRLRAGGPASLRELLLDLEAPPIATIGALAVDDFLPPKERKELAQQLNTLLASPTFAAWQRGAPLDVAAWLAPRADRKTPAVLVSVAHLDDDERALVLSLLFEQLLAWVRGLSGTTDLRALVLFDEVYGFLPPHPANPPTKRPLLALLKQARAFGVGLVLATQNPMDLDYKALSNAGAWFVGRLQTDADRARVVEGLSGADGGGLALAPDDLAATLKALPPRTFFVRDVHAAPSSLLLETRWTLSWLRGPMTRREIGKLARLLGVKAEPTKEANAKTASAEPNATSSTGATRAKEAATANEPAQRSTPSAPSPPAGFKTYFARAPEGAASVRYVPWIAVTVVAGARDAKLGVTRTVTKTFAAPLTDDGRPDLARAAEIDRKNLRVDAAAGAAFVPLPDALAKKSVASAAERALRDHAQRLITIAVTVHEELGVVCEEGEPMDAFVLRCRATAGYRANAEHQAIVQKSSPKLAKLAERRRAAEQKVAEARAEAPGLGGAVGTALLGVFAGKRVASRAASEQSRAAQKVERFERELAEADAALREATAARDAELARLARAVDDAQAGVETRKLAPKKGDVDVTEVAIAWGLDERA